MQKSPANHRKTGLNNAHEILKVVFVCKKFLTAEAINVQKLSELSNAIWDWNTVLHY